MLAIYSDSIKILFVIMIFIFYVIFVSVSTLIKLLELVLLDFILLSCLMSLHVLFIYFSSYIARKVEIFLFHLKIFVI